MGKNGFDAYAGLKTNDDDVKPIDIEDIDAGRNVNVPWYEHYSCASYWSSCSLIYSHYNRCIASTG